MPTVALITSHYAFTSQVDADRELRMLQEGLARRGVEGVLVDWCAPGSAEVAADLVLIKSPWDYAAKVPQFRQWLADVEREHRVLNHPDLVRWNLDKRYLLDLERAGVPVTPTKFAATPGEVADALRASSGRVVVKPNVSAASADTGLFDASDPAAAALAAKILDDGKLVMIQPAVASVAEVGERALVHLDGQFVHSIRKGPLLAPGGGLIGGRVYEEAITPDDAPADERALAAAALGFVERWCAEHGLPAWASPLYARVDIARDDDDRPVLLELELFDPSYFLDLAPGGVEVYVSGVLARLAS